MLPADAFRDTPVLHGETVRLEPLTEAVLEDYVRGMSDAEVTRLTGSHGVFERTLVREWLRTRQDHHDRADWAILRATDGEFLGEVVVNDFDRHNETAGFRIWLASHAMGHGYGTEATRLVVDHVLHHVGVHRLDLEVYEHNPRARRVYEKCGFVLEGRLRDALLWEGRRYDALVMSVLRTEPGPAAEQGPDEGRASDG